ncbi:unnamed protein product [Closterium sp. NIES-53]
MESLRRLATFLFVFVVVGSLLAVVRASFIVQTHSIQITEPKSIRGTYDSAIANFGVPQYGGTLTGVIVYLQNNKAGCTKLSKSEAFKKGVGQRPTILMVDRGGTWSRSGPSSAGGHGDAFLSILRYYSRSPRFLPPPLPFTDCYFSQKVWYAQLGGAPAVLVADTDVESLVTMEAPVDDQETHLSALLPLYSRLPCPHSPFPSPDCYFSQKVWYAQLGGASAVLVADTDTESLVTMEAPVDDQDTDRYVNNITIPSALIEKATGDKIRSALSSGNMVLVDLDWRETLPHPDERVEYELWGTSNDICGPKCNDLTNFLDKFKGLAITLEQGGYTLFTPHYITWYCPPDEVDSIACKNQCIHKGRYCAPDPESDFEEGYDGKDVLVENLRQLCVWKWANESGKPWVWWDYVTDFRKRCSMADKMFNAVCAETVLTSLSE